jgi:preprotein translocase subunit SecE
MGLYGQGWRAGAAAWGCVSMAFPIRKDAMRAVRCVVAVVACVAALAAPARAFADAPAIAYDGNARQLTVSGATGSSGEPDLFLAFKDLMPGDVRDQQIEVRATGVKSQVRVFVRAVVDHETAHMLSPITLTATVGDASAGWLQTGTPGSVFAYPTQIATFTSDGSTVLNLQLSVPTSVGNELADANKTIRWEITAEDDGEKIPVQSAGRKKPGLLGLVATGDNTLTLLLVLLALAIIAFIAALLLSRRNKR